MCSVRVVTDSTSDLPARVAEEWGISVVPCYVNFGTESYLDQVELSRPEFYRRLASGPVHPTTAAPPAGVFAEVYQGLIQESSGIISIHPPDHFSALRQAAVNGWEMAGGEIPYLALDGGQVSMGLGWIALRLAQAAAGGADVTALEATAAELGARVFVFAALESVEFLRRSGRVGWARGTVGKLLRVRPLLRVHRGDISSLGYVRTRQAAIERLVAQVEGLGDVQSIAVLHSNAPERADEFRQRLAHLRPEEQVLTVNITPVVGTHVGPGAIGIAVVQG